MHSGEMEDMYDIYPMAKEQIKGQKLKNFCEVCPQILELFRQGNTCHIKLVKQTEGTERPQLHAEKQVSIDATPAELPEVPVDHCSFQLFVLLINRTNPFSQKVCRLEGCTAATKAGAQPGYQHRLS